MTDNDTYIPHRRSVRLKDYDYSQPGAYFVTICTHERRCLFGEVRGGLVTLNQYGDIVKSCWSEIPQHFPYVQPAPFVVMPNHLHGIIIISERARDLEMQHLRTRRAVSLPNTGVSQPTVEEFGKPVSGSLPTIVRSFKAITTKRITALSGKVTPIWQKRYYEHIIRTEKELNQAIEYINNNPLQWALDRENPENI